MLPGPIVLIILDGWGFRENPQFNAIDSAHTPVFNNLWEQAPHALLSASGPDVGLPTGQMGNSEVGHLTLGAGRVIDQDLCRISKSITDGSFFKNPILLESLKRLATENKALHILGLLSPGGVHSHEDHVLAMLKLASLCKVPRVMVHAFLDGRDTPPKSAYASLQKLEASCKENSNVTTQCSIGSISGRFYAMDRDKRWERIELVYRLLTESIAPYTATTALEALNLAYGRGETDEFVKPTLIQNTPSLHNKDAIAFMNFRSDRARQLSYALWDPSFSGFKRAIIPEIKSFITLTEYDPTLKAKVVFPTQTPKNMLGEYLSRHDISQLRIAETEKYAHVTFFLNGGYESPFAGEDRILVPSPKVLTYDLKPDMSASEITKQLEIVILQKKYQVIICNYANADMVGHTGNFNATRLAIEALDHALGRVIQALKQVNGELLITADHGNAELMFDEATHQPHTAHTTELVPFIYLGRKAHITRATGTLADVAPTMLYLLNLPKPSEMTGSSLVALDS